jgi:hypothetical protein
MVIEERLALNRADVVKELEEARSHLRQAAIMLRIEPEQHRNRAAWDMADLALTAAGYAVDELSLSERLGRMRG